MTKSLHTRLPICLHSIFSSDDGRVAFNRSNERNCKIVINEAESKDNGDWHFQIGLGKKPEVKWHEHIVNVKIKGIFIKSTILNHQYIISNSPINCLVSKNLFYISGSSSHISGWW